MERRFTPQREPIENSVALTDPSYNRARALATQAREDVTQRLIGPNREHIPGEILLRVENGLRNRFLPYVLENESIAHQLNTPEHETFAENISTFLGAKVGFVACPDGRIVQLAYASPKVASFHRRLQGLPQTRASTTDGKAVLDDPALAASITTELEDRITEGKPAEVVEFVGPHIDSMDPAGEGKGCGAQTQLFQKHHRAIHRAMRFGGIRAYFDNLGEGFHAFNNVTEIAGGTATTFDTVFDTYSQGFIVGLRNTASEFDQRLNLRQNLEKLEREKKILMTEKLDDIFRHEILYQAENMGVNYDLETRDYTKLAENDRAISTIAMTITQAIEQSPEFKKEDFAFIPELLREGKSPTAKRVLAYHAIRNVAYRVLGAVIPGEHDLTLHPEQLIQIGPIGARCNVRTIPFIQTTPPGRFAPEDCAAAADLYALSEKVLEQQGVDLSKEARIMVVTGQFNREIYATTKDARRAFNDVASVVRNNAAWLREQFSEAINLGELVIIAGLFNSKSGKMTHVLSRRNDNIDETA